MPAPGPMASLYRSMFRLSNLPPAGFRAPFLQALSSSGLAPHRLELEITERTFSADIDATLATLNRLRSIGVRIALDDFGTGYLSLSCLKSFPFDKLKIDRSFVEDLGTSVTGHAIIRAITTLADALRHGNAGGRSGRP